MVSPAVNVHDNFRVCVRPRRPQRPPRVMLPGMEEADLRGWWQGGRWMRGAVLARRLRARARVLRGRVIWMVRGFGEEG